MYAYVHTHKMSFLPIIFPNTCHVEIHNEYVHSSVFGNTELCVSPPTPKMNMFGRTRDVEQWHPTKDNIVIRHDSSISPVSTKTFEKIII